MKKVLRGSTLIAISFCTAFSLAACSEAKVDTSGTTTQQPAAAESNETKKVGTSRDNPAPLGSVITDGDWSVQVNSVNLDAAEAVAAANSFNEPAPDGKVYILVNITATYTGTKAEGETPTVTVEYVTADGNTVKSYDTFAVAPEPFDNLGTLYEGASATGNVVLTVPAANAAEGVLAVTPSLLGDKVFVAVK